MKLTNHADRLGYSNVSACRYGEITVKPGAEKSRIFLFRLKEFYLAHHTWYAINLAWYKWYGKRVNGKSDEDHAFREKFIHLFNVAMVKAGAGDKEGETVPDGAENCGEDR